MIAIDHSTAAGAAICNLHRRLTELQESEGDLPGGEVTPIIEDWFAELGLPLPPLPDDDEEGV